MYIYIYTRFYILYTYVCNSISMCLLPGRSTSPKTPAISRPDRLAMKRTGWALAALASPSG